MCGVWNKSSLTCTVINVYAPCNFNDKKQLWDVLKMSRNGFAGDLWCVIGYFNSVKCSSERRGVGQNLQVSEMVKFQEFIEDMNLIDLPVLGRRFTWFKPDDSVVSRIDRFLVYDGWINFWKLAAQWVGDKDVSDHCPIMLKGDSCNWGPKSFRFNNRFLKHSDFRSFVENTWANCYVQGRSIYCFKEKLKKLKEGIKVWNIEVFGNLDVKIKELTADLKEYDTLACNTSLFVEEVDKIREITNEQWKVQGMKDNLMHQKARLRWIKEGDSNSAYFHSCVNYQRRRNNFVAIESGGSWVEGVLNVKQAVMSHFQVLYAEQSYPRPLLDGLQFNCLS